MAMKRIKRITSHTGIGRVYREMGRNLAGYIATPRDIPSPYYGSATRSVYEWKGRKCFVSETAHRQYDVFEVPAELIRDTEDEALAEYMKTCQN